MLSEEVTSSNVYQLAERIVNDVLERWLDFEEYAKQQPLNQRFFQKSVDPETGEETLETNFANYYKARNVIRDLRDFFNA